MRAQSFRDWELIVVDDGSTDDTGPIADGHAAKDRRIRVIHQVNGGVSAARNRALCEMDVASEYVSFLDSDDVWEPGALERLLALLSSNLAAVGAHGILRFIDAEGSASPIEWRRNGADPKTQDRGVEVDNSEGLRPDGV